MVTVTVTREPSDIPKERPFPKLMISGGNRVILALKRGAQGLEGVRLAVDGSEIDGDLYYSRAWDAHLFTDFFGTVSITETR